jgi:hypothetical protein
MASQDFNDRETVHLLLQVVNDSYLRTDQFYYNNGSVLL